MGGGGGRNAFSADNRVTATNDAARSLSSDVIAPFRFRRLSVDSIKAILEEEVGAVLIVSRSICEATALVSFLFLEMSISRSGEETLHGGITGHTKNHRRGTILKLFVHEGSKPSFVSLEGSGKWEMDRDAEPQRAKAFIDE